MFTCWLYMNMDLHGFNTLKLCFNVSEYTVSVWDRQPYRLKTKAVADDIKDSIVGLWGKK